jgi:hypothetical protein
MVFSNGIIKNIYEDNYTIQHLCDSSGEFSKNWPDAAPAQNGPEIFQGRDLEKVHFFTKVGTLPIFSKI